MAKLTMINCAFAALAAAASQKYNVMYLIADDLRPEFLEAYDQKVMKTPNLDAFAAGGLVFEHAYCQFSVCGPSRASFMTSRRPHHTNVLDNKRNFRKVGNDANGPGSSWITMPEHFKNAGFLTLGGGKTFHPNHPENWDEPHSWSQVPSQPYFPYSYWINPNASYKGPCPGPGLIKNKSVTGGCSDEDTWCMLDEPDDHFYDFTLANNTVQRLRYAKSVLEESNGETPFFLMSGFARPHAPWRVPKRFWDLYEDDEIALAEHQLPPIDMPGVAWHRQGFFNATDGSPHVPSVNVPLPVAIQREMRHAYYSAVSWLDHQIGTVLKELDTLGLTDTTIVLLHGDHGWQLGEHNSWHKFTNFELGTRVPLMMRAPWIKTSVGKRTKVFAELIDMYPTLAEMTNSAAPHDVLDGVSLAPAFADPTITTIKTDKGTMDKSVAYSQFPHTDDWNCTFVRGGKCYSKPSAASSLLVNANVASPQAKGNWMGYAVRNESWRFVMWLPADKVSGIADWTATPLLELYNYTVDQMLVSYDDLDVVNLAYHAEFASSTAHLQSECTKFFRDVLPPQPLPPSPSPPGPTPPSPGPAPSAQCTAAGGISGKGKNKDECCPKRCGKCGGTGCSNAPGGKENCCAQEVAKNGKDCRTSKAPCTVKG